MQREYRLFQTVYESPSDPIISIEVLIEYDNGFREVETVKPVATYFDAYVAHNKRLYDMVAKIDYNYPTKEGIYEQLSYLGSFKIIEVYHNPLLPYTWTID